MTNRLTRGIGFRIPQTPYISGMFRFKERDSYHEPTVYCSCTEGGRHA